MEFSESLLTDAMFRGKGLLRGCCFWLMSGSIGLNRESVDFFIFDCRLEKSKEGGEVNDVDEVGTDFMSWSRMWGGICITGWWGRIMSGLLGLDTIELEAAECGTGDIGGEEGSSEASSCKT